MHKINKLIREPLVHFLFIGAMLFLAFGFTREPESSKTKRITVNPEQVEQLTAQFKRTRLRQPTEEELAGVIEGYVRDEVYYREAMSMGLDRNDPQVRLRMRLKLEFLLDDLTAEAPPDDETLQSYLKQHADRFRIEPQVSFQQVYFHPDKHKNLDDDLQSTMVRLKAGDSAELLGDSTLLQFQYTALSQYDIARIFGENFAAQVAAFKPGEWSGPLVSQMGVHLVKVSKRISARIPELSEIRAQVERDYLARRRQELKEINYKKLREGYEIVIQTPAPKNSKPGTAVAASRSGEDR